MPENSWVTFRQDYTLEIKISSSPGKSSQRNLRNPSPGNCLQFCSIIPATSISQGKYFSRRCFLHLVNPVLLLVGTETQTPLPPPQKKQKQNPHTPYLPKPSVFQGLSDSPETNYLNESVPPPISAELENIQKAFFFPRPCSISHSLLLANLDFCASAGPELGSTQRTAQGICWTLHVLTATGAQRSVGKVRSQRCPAQGHGGLPPASPTANATACCAPGGFACYSYSVHPHVHAFTFHPASASAKLQRQPVNLHHIWLPHMVYLYQTGKRG